MPLKTDFLKLLLNYTRLLVMEAQLDSDNFAKTLEEADVTLVDILEAVFLLNVSTTDFKKDEPELVELLLQFINDLTTIIGMTNDLEIEYAIRIVYQMCFDVRLIREILTRKTLLMYIYNVYNSKR